MASVEVYIVSEEPMQGALASLLAAAGLPFRAFSTASAFLRDCHRLPPGCIVASLRMSEMGGLELLRRLKAEKVSYPTIIVADDTDIPQAVAAMQAGATDFIEKPYDDDGLLRAIRAALRLEARISPRITRRLSQTTLAALTPREHDVLDGVMDGKTNKMIALERGISPRTVETHRANVMIKSGARSVSELVRMALLADHQGAARS